MYLLYRSLICLIQPPVLSSLFPVYPPLLSIHSCHSSLLHFVHSGNSAGLPACHPFLAHSHFSPPSASPLLLWIEYHIRFPALLVCRSALLHGYGSTQWYLYSHSYTRLSNTRLYCLFRILIPVLARRYSTLKGRSSQCSLATPSSKSNRKCPSLDTCLNSVLLPDIK